MPSAKRRQDHVLDGVREHVRPADQQGVEQQEAGDDRALEAGRETAGEGQQLQRHAEQQDEEEAPEELRQRQQHDRAGVGDRLLSGAAHVKHEQPARDAERARDQHREQRQFDRRRQGRADQAGDAAAEMDRGAEVAVHDLAEPDQVLPRNSGWSSPISWRFASISASVAFGGNDIAAGSAGSRRRIRTAAPRR